MRKAWSGVGTGECVGERAGGTADATRAREVRPPTVYIWDVWG